MLCEWRPRARFISCYRHERNKTNGREREIYEPFGLTAQHALQQHIAQSQRETD